MKKSTVFIWVCAAVLAAGCADSAATSSAGGDTGSGTSTDTKGDARAKAQLQTLASGQQGDTEVELLAAAPLVMGYNPVFYRVKVAGQLLTSATLTQQPLMKMPMMQHACPLEQPAATANADGLFAAALLPQMASGADGGWTLAVVVEPPGDTTRTVSLGSLTVGSAPWAKTLVVGSGMAAQRYTVVIDWLQPPTVGVNSYRVAVHQASSDMLSYAPVLGATFTAGIEMPSMGHGSSGNVTPVSSGGGWYAGKAACSMPGDWRLTLGITVGGKALGNAVFDFDL